VFDDKAHVEHDGKLPDLLNLMWGGWHRVPITKDGAIIDFVTQSDVLQFMVNHMRLILGYLLPSVDLIIFFLELLGLAIVFSHRVWEISVC